MPEPGRRARPDPAPVVVTGPLRRRDRRGPGPPGRRGRGRRVRPRPGSSGPTPHLGHRPDVVAADAFDAGQDLVNRAHLVVQQHRGADAAHSGTRVLPGQQGVGPQVPLGHGQLAVADAVLGQVPELVGHDPEHLVDVVRRRGARDRDDELGTWPSTASATASWPSPRGTCGPTPCWPGGLGCPIPHRRLDAAAPRGAHVNGSWPASKASAATTSGGGRGGGVGPEDPGRGRAVRAGPLRPGGPGPRRSRRLRGPVTTTGAGSGRRSPAGSGSGPPSAWLGTADGRAVSVLVVVPLVLFVVPALRLPGHRRGQHHPELPPRALTGEVVRQGHLPLGTRHLVGQPAARGSTPVRPTRSRPPSWSCRRSPLSS